MIDYIFARYLICEKIIYITILYIRRYQIFFINEQFKRKNANQILACSTPSLSIV